MRPGPPLYHLANPSLSELEANQRHASVTEILDVAPVDAFAELSKATMEHMPDGFVSKEAKAQALDFEFFWVNEKGDHAALTAGMSVKMTVSF